MKPFVLVCVSPCWDSTVLVGERDRWWGCWAQITSSGCCPFGSGTVKVSPPLSGRQQTGMQEEGLFSMNLPPVWRIKLWPLMRLSTWSHFCTSLHVDYWNCHFLLIILLAPCKQCVYSSLWFLCGTGSREISSEHTFKSPHFPLSFVTSCGKARKRHTNNFFKK